MRKKSNLRNKDGPKVFITDDLKKMQGKMLYELKQDVETARIIEPDDEGMWSSLFKLLTIHCVSHRLALAIKDSLLKHPEFVSVNEIMSTIFYVMKQSGKFKRQFHVTAEALGVHLPEGPRHSFHQPSAERGAGAVAQLDSIDCGY